MGLAFFIRRFSTNRMNESINNVEYCASIEENVHMESHFENLDKFNLNNWSWVPIILNLKSLYDCK